MSKISRYIYRADGKAATDSRLPPPRPNTDNGTFDIVTTECLLPDVCGACVNVAKNSASCNKITEKACYI